LNRRGEAFEAALGDHLGEPRSHGGDICSVQCDGGADHAIATGMQELRIGVDEFALVPRPARVAVQPGVVGRENDVNAAGFAHDWCPGGRGDDNVSGDGTAIVAVDDNHQCRWTGCGSIA